ncbi:putative ATP-dependent RNA helicase [Podospora fimiseda]|uniref:ATP-dependent RNA helicase ROK1 n=1 Tax=Podospora fimiseda TaxID=252190 RepID=A0AAN7BX05_9PEZI|nr:putative ATP-dependent RNA helicase [Podospora fimiseda]
MDILKVLSRGIKPAAKAQGAQSGATTAALPSSGALPHPQLFHDPVASSTTSRGKKRKRRKAQQEGEVDQPQGEEDEELSDVDFFAPPKTKNQKTEAQENVSTNTTKEEKKKHKKKLLDEEECRQIFKSHRLKFTVLHGQRDQVAEPEEEGKKKKTSKKDKDQKEEENRKKQNHQLQLFPQPLTAFGQLKYDYGISPIVSRNITREGFRVPTEVQMGSLPLLLQPVTALKKAQGIDGLDLEKGVDFLAVAPTGSGKTITFLIPVIEDIIKRRQKRKKDTEDGAEEQEQEHVLEAIVVAPTKELASQIVSEGRKLAIGSNVRVSLMRRGTKLYAEKENKLHSLKEEDSEDEEEEKKQDGDVEEEPSDEEPGDEETKGKKKPQGGEDILVTTPLTLLNFLTNDGKPGVKKILPTVRNLILDEADVLLDPIFRKQTMGIWRACANPDLGITCWSATMASNVEALITTHLQNRAKHFSLPLRPLIRLVVGLKDTAVPNVTHKLIYTATEPGKLLALRQLLHPTSTTDSGPPLRPPFLVFTQTIERAQGLHDELKYDIPLEAGGSARIAVLHSELSEKARAKTMARFRAGEIWVLITTDVLARGVDFAGVNGVVNFDVPTSPASYVHRAGRTGRAGREGGVAVTFYTKDDIPFVKSVANVIAASERQAGISEDQGTIKKWLLDALPDVAKEDRKKLKQRGVESRRTGAKGGDKGGITTKSGWERKRENNRKGAIEASKKRKKMQKLEGNKAESDGEEWGGLDD